MANKLRASGQIQDKDRYIPISEAKKQMVTMLTEILLEIEECGVEDSHWIIKEKINALKVESEEK